MDNETKTFSQFSERLTDLNLKTKKNKTKQNDEKNDLQVSILESLLGELKKQTGAVKETLSHRNPISNDTVPIPKKKYVNDNNFSGITSTPMTNSNNNHASNVSVVDNINMNNSKNQMMNKIPIIKSIKIEDDLINESIPSKTKDHYQSKYQNYGSYLDGISVSSSVLANNSNIPYTFGNPSDSVKELSMQASQINDDPFNELKKKSEIKKDMNDNNLQMSKDGLKKSREGSGKKGLETKSSFENNPMIVDVIESEGSDIEDKKELDYYSKTYKKTNNNQIHDILEEKDESDEEEKEKRLKEQERIRIERENEIKRKQKEEEEIRRRKEMEREREKEELERQKKKEALEKKKRKEKEALENKKREEEFERQKEKEKEALKRRRQKEKEVLEKKKRDEELQKQRKEEEEEEEELERQRIEKQKKKEIEANNKKKQKANKENTNSSNDNENEKESQVKNTQPPAEYINIEIEDIDDIPELAFEEIKKKSIKNTSSKNAELRSSQNKTKAKEESKQKPNEDNDNDDDDDNNKDTAIIKKTNVDKNKSEVLKSKKKQMKKNINERDNENQIDCSQMRERIFKEMVDFDTNNPEMKKDEFTLIKSFEGKERHLVNIIQNYQQTVLECEGNKVFLQRRKAFLDNAYFKSRIVEDDSKNDFIVFFQKLPNPYSKVIYENYQKRRKKDQLFPKNYNYNNPNLFEYDPKIGCTLAIGDIENISTFAYKYSLNLCPNLMDTAIRTFSHWRNVRCDGNSFYRVIMFSIIDHFILNKKIEGIEMICNEIHLLNDALKEKKIDIEPALIVFKLIIDELNNDNINEAHDIFIKGYNNMKNDMVDRTLIFYLRNVISQYIKDTYVLIEDEVKKTNAKLDKSYFMNYLSVLENNIEPELDIVDMVKYLFNTDIEIFWMDGPFEDPLFAHSKLINNNKNNNEDELSVNKIYLGFFFSSYHIIYPNKQQIESEILKEKMSQANASFTQLVFVDKKNKKQCGLCGKSAAKIYFLQKLFYTCVECLKEYIDKIMTERAKNYVLANFVSFEYYTRDIQLNKDFHISNYDFIEVIKTITIGEKLFNLVQTICFECGEYLNPDKSSSNRNELKCRCCYCKKCLWEKQLKATNSLKVINKFEKFKFAKTQCICDHPFDSADAQRFFPEITDEDIKNAQDRMNRYINTMCCICINVKMEPEKLAEFTSITIIPDNSPNKGIDYSDIPHMICQQCFKAEKTKIQNSLAEPVPNINDLKNKEDNNNNIANKDDIVILKCNICRRKHNTNKKDWNPKKNEEKDENVCCNMNYCIIY